MKLFLSFIALSLALSGCVSPAQDDYKLFIDVHDLKTGKENTVAEEHQKGDSVQNNYDVQLLNCWIDKTQGKMFCLNRAKDSVSVYLKHKTLGIVPYLVEKVIGGSNERIDITTPLLFDIHRLGPGNINFQDAQNVHVKDIAVQDRHNVNFINYWIDEKMGIVMCLVQAADSVSLADSHREAHGLVPDKIYIVQQAN
jgi:predicted phosphatase